MLPKFLNRTFRDEVLLVFRICNSIDDTLLHLSLQAKSPSCISQSLLVAALGFLTIKLNFHSTCSSSSSFLMTAFPFFLGFLPLDFSLFSCNLWWSFQHFFLAYAHCPTVVAIIFSAILACFRVILTCFLSCSPF